MRVHPEGAPIDVPPEEGRLALFYADEMPHEVLPTVRERHSVNLWYFDQAQLAAARGRSTK